MGKIAVLGTSLLDQIMMARGIISTKRCNKMNATFSYGGAARNIAYNLSALGNEVHFVTKLGDDMHAFEIQKELEAAHVIVYPIFMEAPTPVFISAMDAEKSLMFSTITDDFKLNDKDLKFVSAISNCSYGITDSDDTTFLRKLMDRTPDVKWVLAGEVISKHIIKNAHGMIVNRHEMASMAQGSSAEGLAQNLIINGLDWLVVTLDNEGAMYFDKTGSHYYPISPKISAYTLGCGDAFIAGFMDTLDETNDLHTSMLKGLEASAIVLDTPSATTLNIRRIKKT